MLRETIYAIVGQGIAVVIGILIFKATNDVGLSIAIAVLAGRITLLFEQRLPQ